MADIATAWSPALGVGDWIFTPPSEILLTTDQGLVITGDDGTPIGSGFFADGAGLEIGNDLGTAILISLFTDAAAGPEDVIPDGSRDPRGWWGDLGADRPIGSKIWLLGRSKQVELTRALAKAYVEAALAWLVDDGIAARVDVETEWTRPGMLGVRVVITRADGSTIALRFAWAWTEIA